MDKQTGRFVRLLVELGEEIKEELRRDRGGKDRGWQTALARRVGLDAGYVSKLLTGARDSVGDDSIAKVIEKTRIRGDYFYGPTEPLSYRDYLRSRYVAYDEFLATPMGRIAKTKYPQYLQALETMSFPFQPTVHLYQSLLTGMIGSAAQAEAMLVTTESVAEQLEEDRRSRPAPKRGRNDESDGSDE